MAVCLFECILDGLWKNEFNWSFLYTKNGLVQGELFYDIKNIFDRDRTK